MVFARNLTKCGNKGKYGRQAAFKSLMVGRCAGAQGLGDHTMGGGRGGEVNTEHGSIYTYTYTYIYIHIHLHDELHIFTAFGECRRLPWRLGPRVSGACGTTWNRVT